MTRKPDARERGRELSGCLGAVAPGGGTFEPTTDCTLPAEMAYDEELARRVREQLAAEDGVTEKAMFGGLAFMLHGNMAITASSHGGLMVRVGIEAADDALASPHTQQIEMRGRPMPGWIYVAAEGLKAKRQVAAWARRGVEFTRTLPRKS
jgi:TfoX/Sxy family transcriptional regulator of competence genes